MLLMFMFMGSCGSWGLVFCGCVMVLDCHGGVVMVVVMMMMMFPETLFSFSFSDRRRESSESEKESCKSCECSTHRSYLFYESDQRLQKIIKMVVDQRKRIEQ